MLAKVPAKIVSSICRTSMFWMPERQVSSAWTEHVPFAFWLVDILRPGTIVELGTYNGVSYSAMCQAVKLLELSSNCFAIDTWKGDKHAGFYSEDVYRDFSEFNNLRYGAFSRLVRSTFDEALGHFENGSIDLLHIDGLHTYEAVRHDFDSWGPKLSPSAVVLFHDTNVREGDFGVHKFWHEVSASRPHFTFFHGHGLGVLGSDHHHAPELQLLFGATENDRLASAIRAAFARLGHSIELMNEISSLRRVDAERETKLTETSKELSGRETEVASLEEISSKRAQELAILGGALAERDSKINAFEKLVAIRDEELIARSEQISVLEKKLAASEAQNSSIIRSTSWRITAPLRFIGHMIRHVLKIAQSRS